MFYSFRILFFFICIALVFVYGCEQKTSQNKTLIIGHTRASDNKTNKVCQGVANINYSNYAQLILLGDLTNNSSESIDQLNYLDAIFKIKSEDTHWAFGNHDYYDTKIATAFTKKPTYYAFYKNKATYIILDTQKDECFIIGDQYEMLKSCLDTIAKSKAVFLLAHKPIWMMDTENLQEIAPNIVNGGIGTGSPALKPNNFYPLIFSPLLQLSLKGIQVFCIAGDIGFKTLQYQKSIYETLYYLATGFNGDSDKGYGLVFAEENGEFSWEFVPLQEL